MLLTGCVGALAGTPTDGASSSAGAPSTVVSEVSLEEAKETAQAMELEIAGLVPSEVVVSVDQMPKGTLFSCSETEWRWKGATTVTVRKGTDIEAIVRAVQVHYEGVASIWGRGRTSWITSRCSSRRRTQRRITSSPRALDRTRFASRQARFASPFLREPGHAVRSDVWMQASSAIWNSGCCRLRPQRTSRGHVPGREF